MKIERIENPQADLVAFLSSKIVEFNWAHWEVASRDPLAVQVTNEQGEVLAGAAARSFGDWLLLDTLWVSEDLRGQDIGSQLLAEIEAMGIERGCKKCLLDTLNFQAKPFYEQRGYLVPWVLEGYPKTGCKYFMVKDLIS